MNLKSKTEEELLTIQKSVEEELKSRRLKGLYARDRRFLQEFLDNHPDYEVRFREDNEYGDTDYFLEIKHKKLSKWESIDTKFLQQDEEDWHDEYSKIVPDQMSEIMEGCYEYRGDMEVGEYLDLVGFALER